MFCKTYCEFAIFTTVETHFSRADRRPFLRQLREVKPSQIPMSMERTTDQRRMFWFPRRTMALKHTVKKAHILKNTIYIGRKLKLSSVGKNEWNYFACRFIARFVTWSRCCRQCHKVIAVTGHWGTGKSNNSPRISTLSSRRWHFLR